ncbi:MAG TPA: FAD-dependent oxidoreductase [Bacteroidia bacterium]|nr:FAD-dependent oxidoreductase [Bacteroidia bacterium]
MNKSMNYSYWEQETFIKSLDVAVIGGGIVGLSSAIYLKQANPELKVIVLEKGVMLDGASLRNAGFACFGSPTELLDDLSKRTEKEVFTLVEKRWKGLAELRNLLGDAAIEYEPLGGYEVFDDESSFRESKDAIDRFNRLLVSITGEKETYKVVDEQITSFGLKGIAHIIKNKSEGQLNTGKMMQAFMRKATELGIIIANGVEVLDYKEEGNEVTLNTTWQSLKIKKLLLATNAYTLEIEKSLDVKPARAQVLITSPIPGLKIKGAFHYDKGYYYFRNVGQRLLLGGGRNLDFAGETTTEIALTQKIQSRLEELLSNTIIPGCKYQIEHRWSGIMGLGSNDKSPIVKAISPNVYCAVRLGGMGVALGSLVGRDAANLIMK